MSFITMIYTLNTATLSLKSSRYEQRAACRYCFFCEQKDLMQIRFTLKCIQYNYSDTLLQSQQLRFCVRKCYIGKNMHQLTKCNKSFISDLNSSQDRFLHPAFRILLTDKTKYLKELGQYVEK